ncbi:histidinol dehydrogenase [Fulvivirga aurantia]|uniref:histidinol dehydrogenase n=1 Tax=Fulvivirga aurantia TaxID=2529383 RepID=UPI001CA454F7|nr:histidinol dehydrogenase [Fulvivirga aurantia]
MLTIKKYPKPEQWASILQRPVLETDFLESAVRNILTRVKASGDKALFEFNEQFDKSKIDALQVSEDELKSADDSTDVTLKTAIKQAYENIYTFHKEQKREELRVDTMPGVTCWRKALPIEKVGLYIPGGTAPLFSSVLMLGIPAKIAGCSEIVLCTPPQPDGNINPAILYAAKLVGITKVYKVGGAQAIAAMAYGTESIARVDKIFGPGNQYVTAAKQMVSLQGTAIDMPAGPSEVMVLADESSNADFIASDLLSQAEHGKDSQVVLLSTDESLLESVNKAIEKQIESLPRKVIAVESLSKSVGVLVKDTAEMMQMSNAYAPEHLIIATKNAETLADQVINAGSVFIGAFTPESAGDYASGTNHTLPTNGAARAYSGVSLDSFTKQVTFQQITEGGIKSLGPTIELMAEAEELAAHKNAVSLRLKYLENGN